MVDWGMLVRLLIAGVLMFVASVVVGHLAVGLKRRGKKPVTYRAIPKSLPGQALRVREPEPGVAGDVPKAVASVASFPETKVAAGATGDDGITPREAFDLWLVSDECDPSSIGFPPHPAWSRPAEAELARRMELVKAGEWPGVKEVHGE